MDGFLFQINNIIVNPPGGLAFILALIFCITTTLQAVFLQRQNPRSYKTRLVLGISALLISQVILLLASALSWRFPASGHVFLPPVERTVNLFSLVMIAWVWTYPSPHRLADISAAALSVIIFIIGTLTFVFWTRQQPFNAFNISQLDQVWNIISILVTLCLITALVAQRPQSWVVGIYILVLHLAGFIVHYISGVTSSDLAASIRLAQLLTYPCLPLLTQRLILKPEKPDRAWPLITSLEAAPLPPPPSAAVEAPQVIPSFQDSIEYLGLKNQLELSNQALSEANLLIDNLKIENQKLAQPPQVETPAAAPAPVIPVSTEPGYIQVFARGVTPFIANIDINARLVKAEGIGVLGALQRSFLNEAIELSNQVLTATRSLAVKPEDPAIILKNFKHPELISGIDSAVANVNQALRNKSITLRLDLPENPAPISISQNILEQILVHLLQNAIQATPAEETISLKVEESKDDSGASLLVIHLTDTGGGVTVKNLDKIFSYKPAGIEPRYRGIGSLTALHLAKTMVDAYGGKIWLESKAKQTTYYVQIPI